ncbi:unnamed protein product [Mytilus edulis]|uniref:Mutator-like transposase domain-containing protein n=1 Tax=Mytilus edulis TaxID=6550 RepID=A0A8S3T688_MYTED|nr:unnamed protein product [Mytilus edulis]
MTLVDTYLKANVSSADQFTYKIFQQNALQYMINTEMKNHMLYKQDCKGDLKFDTEAQVKWGLAWQERFQCNICGFKSAFHKLYEEVESLKRGRRAATVNIGAQVGLIHTPISNKNFSEILNAANIISPSSSGLQKCANKVSKVVEKVNKDDMENIRKNLANDNKTLGLSIEKLVRVESDARAGTQVTQVMCENMTKNKKIISLYTGNKLCLIASKLRGKGKNVTCPNHAGLCTANIAEDFPIGNEGEYSRRCAAEVSDHLQISHFTSDGDSKSFTGIKSVHGNNVQSLRDVRHLSQSLKRAIMKCTFSEIMFSGSRKQNEKSRFALDIKARCVAELNTGFSVHKGNLQLMKAHMPNVIDAIIMCYKGNCGSSCKVNSYVCGGEPSKCWIRSYKANDSTLKMTVYDQEELRRNFPGRAHAAVLMVNNKYSNSVIKLSVQLGAAITPGSLVAKQLKQRHKIDIRNAQRKRLISSKLRRANSRRRKYKLHASIHYPLSVYYKKGLADSGNEDSDNICD